MRIQKALAQLGLGSRREIERWISEGFIQINGQVAHLGDQITKKDQVTVKGQPVSLAKLDHVDCQVLLFHKPTGVICTRDDPQQRQTVFELLPDPNFGRWVSVGRLDLNTSGLLLLTNDGELANRLMHPRYQIERVYQCRVYGKVKPQHLAALQGGIMLAEGLAKFEQVELIRDEETANPWYKVTLREGKYREVRRLWESQDIRVNRLVRVQYANVTLPNTLNPGQYKLLSPLALKALRELVGLTTP